MLTFILMSVILASLVSLLIGIVVFFIQLTWPLFLIVLAISLFIGLIAFILS